MKCDEYRELSLKVASSFPSSSVSFFCLDVKDSFISTIVAVDDSPRVVLFTFCVHFTTKRAAQPSKKEMFELAVHI